MRWALNYRGRLSKAGEILNYRAPTREETFAIGFPTTPPYTPDIHRYGVGGRPIDSSEFHRPRLQVVAHKPYEFVNDPQRPILAKFTFWPVKPIRLANLRADSGMMGAALGILVYPASYESFSCRWNQSERGVSIYVVT